MTEQEPRGSGLPAAFEQVILEMDESLFPEDPALKEDEFTFGVSYDDVEYVAEIFERKKAELIESEKTKSETSKNETPRIERVSAKLSQAREEFSGKKPRCEISLSAKDFTFLKDNTYGLSRGLTKREQEMLLKCKNSFIGSFKKFLRKTKNEEVFRQVFPYDGYRSWFGR